MKDPRRNGMKNMLNGIEFEGMSGIGPSLKTGNHIISGCQYIHNLSLAFVSPLKA